MAAIDHNFGLPNLDTPSTGGETVDVSPVDGKIPGVVSAGGAALMQLAGARTPHNVPRDLQLADFQESTCGRREI